MSKRLNNEIHDNKTNKKFKFADETKQYREPDHFTINIDKYFTGNSDPYNLYEEPSINLHHPWTYHYIRQDYYNEFREPFFIYVSLNIMEKLKDIPSKYFKKHYRSSTMVNQHKIIDNMMNPGNLNYITIFHDQSAYKLGRFYPLYNDSPNVLSGVIKHTLCKKLGFVYINMVKCHPTILQHFFSKNGTNTLVEMQKYIENPNEYMTPILEYYGVNKDMVKILFSILMYGGNFKKWLKKLADQDIQINKDDQCERVKLFEQECKIISEKIVESNERLKDRIIEIDDKFMLNEDNDNIDGTVVSYFCQVYENEILYKAYKYLLKEGFLEDRINVLLEYDGLMFKLKDGKTESDLISEIDNLNAFILQETGIPMKFAKKEWERNVDGILDDVQLLPCNVDPFIVDHITNTICENFVAGPINDDLLIDLIYMLDQGKHVYSTSNNSWWYFNNQIFIKTKSPNFLSTVIRDISNIFRLKKDFYNSAMTRSISIEDKNFNQSKKTLFHTLSNEVRNCAFMNRCSTQLIGVFSTKSDEFETKLNKNPFLLAFKNGVFDFKEKCFRDPRLEDYISISTKINYIPFESILNILKNPEHEQYDYYMKGMKIIDDFMIQLFHDESLVEFMWAYLAMFCLGWVDSDNAFFIWYGPGANGKSLLTQLLHMIFGDYSTTFPSYLFEKHKCGVVPDCIKYARIASITAWGQHSQLNQNCIEKYTNSPYVLFRGSGRDKETFTLQCKFVCHTNTGIKIINNIDERQRKVKVIPFKSVFVQFKHELDNMRHKYPSNRVYFTKPKIVEELLSYKELFMSRLVDIAMKTEGKLPLNDIVEKATQEYIMYV